MKIYVKVKADNFAKESRSLLFERLYSYLIALKEDDDFKLIGVDKLEAETRLFAYERDSKDFKGELLSTPKTLSNDYLRYLYENSVHQLIFTKKNIKSRLPKFVLSVTQVKDMLFELKLYNEHKCLARSIFWNNYNDKELIKLAEFVVEEMKPVSYRKNALRSIVKFYKDSLSDDKRLRFSQEIMHKLRENSAYQKAKLVFIYWSMNDEVDTIKFIEDEHKKGKEFILPVIVERDLILKRFTGTKDLQGGNLYGIPEPVGEEFNEYYKIDLAVIPGVAFNHKGDRLGRGKGYYDKILDDLSTKTPLVGLGFSFQMFEDIPVEYHDKKLDLILTNTNDEGKNEK